jgi:hypothetical protein
MWGEGYAVNAFNSLKQRTTFLNILLKLAWSVKNGKNGIKIFGFIFKLNKSKIIAFIDFQDFFAVRFTLSKT